MAFGLLGGGCVQLRTKTTANVANDSPPPTAESAKAHLAPLLKSGAISEITFSSMGTVWIIQISDRKSINLQSLQRALMEEALLFDRTFSDWMKDSELRKLERSGLTQKQIPSALFMRGLKLAVENYQISEGRFDITVGAVIWKALENPVGLSQLVIEGNAFHFNQDPKRLTFNGFIKGSATGAMAERLRAAGLRNFMINGGGGNYVAMGTRAGENWISEQASFSPREMIFVSHSNSQQDATQHVIDPAHPNQKIERQATVICRASAKPQSWFREAGIADALSTALLINADLKNLPENCHSTQSQKNKR